MSVVIDPDLVRVRSAQVDVDTSIGPERGRTLYSFTDDGAGPPSPAGGTPTLCQVATDVDVPRFRELILSPDPPVCLR